MGNAKFIDSHSLGEFADATKRDRFQRVSEVDRSCRQAMVSEGRTFAETVNNVEAFLPEGETIKSSLKVVAIKNLPTLEHDETAVGDGWLVITESPGCNVRLHILMSTEDAKFDAEEVWLQQRSGCLCCKKRNRQVRARYASSHSQSLQVTTLNCLFSPSSHLVDSSDLEVYFGNQTKPTPKPIQRLPSGVRRKESHCLSSLKQGLWQKEVAFKHDLEKMMEKSLTSVNDQASYKFPDIEAVQDKEERFQRTTKHQLVHFQYVSPSGALEDFEAWASQEEPLEKVMKFAMSLGLLCSEIAPPEHVEHAVAGGITSLLGGQQTKSARRPLKLLNPSTRRQLPASVEKKRLCQCLFILTLLAFILYAIFAIVVPRVHNALQTDRTNTLQIDAFRANNSTRRWR